MVKRQIQRDRSFLKVRGASMPASPIRFVSLARRILLKPNPFLFCCSVHQIAPVLGLVSYEIWHIITPQYLLRNSISEYLRAIFF